MTDEQDSDRKIYIADTVPPPAGGDAYSAATVVREAPPEVLEAIRQRSVARAEQAASSKPPPRVKAPRVAPTPAFRPPVNHIPRFNLDDDDPDIDDPDMWEAPEEIVEVVRQRRESGRPSSPVSSRSASPSSHASGKPGALAHASGGSAGLANGASVNEALAAYLDTDADNQDVDDQAMTRLRRISKEPSSGPVSVSRVTPDESPDEDTGLPEAAPELATHSSSAMPIPIATSSERPPAYPFPLGSPRRYGRVTIWTIALTILALSALALMWLAPK
jgi:hypothetical protein